MSRDSSFSGSDWQAPDYDPDSDPFFGWGSSDSDAEPEAEGDPADQLLGHLGRLSLGGAEDSSASSSQAEQGRPAPSGLSGPETGAPAARTQGVPPVPAGLGAGFRIYTLWACPLAEHLRGVWFGPDREAWPLLVNRLPGQSYQESQVKLRRYYSWEGALRGWWQEGPHPRPTREPLGRRL